MVTFVAFEVGEMVGDMEGDMEGEMDGDMEGDTDGDVVFRIEGATDGVVVFCVEGEAVVVLFCPDDGVADGTAVPLFCNEGAEVPVAGAAVSVPGDEVLPPVAGASVPFRMLGELVGEPPAPGSGGPVDVPSPPCRLRWSRVSLELNPSHPKANAPAGLASARMPSKRARRITVFVGSIFNCAGKQASSSVKQGYGCRCHCRANLVVARASRRTETGSGLQESSQERVQTCGWRTLCAHTTPNLSLTAKVTAGDRRYASSWQICGQAYLASSARTHFT
jgi:hypothetical protein